MIDRETLEKLFRGDAVDLPPVDPNDGGQVLPPGFEEQEEEMRAKWARGEYPIQQMVGVKPFSYPGSFDVENVTQPTDDEQMAMASWIYAIEWATREPAA